MIESTKLLRKSPVAVEIWMQGLKSPGTQNVKGTRESDHIFDRYPLFEHTEIALWIYHVAESMQIQG